MTYWFRLQNTTLFFYTKKNGSASHLRGNYYIYTVQSVREVQRADSKRFMFEIIMMNGKRKLLAAETAALRQEWVGHLWQAMHLSTSGVVESRSIHLEVHEQRERIYSSTPTCSHTDSVMELLPYRPFSAPTGDIHHEIRSIASPIHQSEEVNSEESTYQTTLPTYTCQHHKISLCDPVENGPRTGTGGPLVEDRWSSGSSGLVVGNAEGQEGDYDVLPIRKKICDISASTEMDDDVYDVPPSYRRAAEHLDPTENIYDVPSSLLRMTSDHSEAFSSGEQLQDGVCWRI